MKPIVMRSLGATSPLRPSADAGMMYGAAMAEATAVVLRLRNWRRENFVVGRMSGDPFVDRAFYSFHGALQEHTYTCNQVLPCSTRFTMMNGAYWRLPLNRAT